MSNAFQRLSPLTQSTLLALFAGVFSFVFTRWGHTHQIPTQDALQLALFLAAICYIFPPTTNSALAMYRADPRIGWRNPYRWLYAYQIGYSWTVAMALLIVIPDAEPETLAVIILICAFGGLLFGAIMAVMTKDSAPTGRYNTAEALARTGFRKAIPLVWPFITIILLAIFIGENINGKIPLEKICGQALILGHVVRAAKPQFEGGPFSKSAFVANAPFLIGIILLITAYFAF